MNWIKCSIPIVKYVKYNEEYEHVNQPINMALVLTYFKRNTKQIDFYYNNNSAQNIVWKFESEEQTDKTLDYIGTFLNIKTI